MKKIKTKKEIDWTKAPDWANYIAMDSDCEWYWYEHKPNPIHDLNVPEWYSEGRKKYAYSTDWTNTLQERPR